MRTNMTSTSPWEDIVGYSRAVVCGDQMFLAGTTATDGNGAVVAPGDMYAQTRYVLEKIEQVLIRANSCMADVVQTRMFVTDISRWDEVARAHREYFHAVRPAATMVEVARLIHADMLVEIEITAIIGSSNRPAEGAMR